MDGYNTLLPSMYVAIDKSIYFMREKMGFLSVYNQSF